MEFSYCPKCGASLLTFDDNGVARLICGKCRYVLYRNSKPAAGVLVEMQGKILLARRACEPSIGRWDIPGGFLELGEHPEAGALREVKEETGLDVELDGILGMYIDHYQEPEEMTLNIYYRGHIKQGVLRADSDVDQLRWFSCESLPSSEYLAFQNVHLALQDWLQWAHR